MSGTDRLVLAVRPRLLREGLACLLSQHGEVAVVGHGAEVRALIEQHAPDVLLAEAGLIDGDVPGEEGPRVVVLLDEREGEPVRRRVPVLLDAGVVGFVSVRDGAATMLDALRSAARGEEVFLGPSVAARMAPADGRDGDVAEILTQRQRDVLERIALGYPNARIAAELGLAPGTVRNHLSGLYARLGVRTRAEAVGWAWRHGLAGHDGLRPDGPSKSKKSSDP